MIWLVLEVVPMFHSQSILKSKNFKTDFQDIEIVIGVSKNVVTILKNSDDINTGRRF